MQAAQLSGVALGQPPSAVSFVLATKLVTLGRIVARLGSVAHHGQLRYREQLKLPLLRHN
jgi:hypothetical protein